MEITFNLVNFAELENFVTWLLEFFIRKKSVFPLSLSLALSLPLFLCLSMFFTHLLVYQIKMSSFQIKDRFLPMLASSSKIYH